MRALGRRVAHRWQRWLRVRRAENRVADCIVVGASYDDLIQAHRQLREARRS